MGGGDRLPILGVGFDFRKPLGAGKAQEVVEVGEPPKLRLAPPIGNSQATQLEPTWAPQDDRLGGGEARAGLTRDDPMKASANFTRDTPWGREDGLSVPHLGYGAKRPECERTVRVKR